MYGQMQFADYVVGYALQTLSRCLLKVRGRDGALSCADERMIAQNTRQILSLWNMAEWSVGKLPYERACARLEEVVYLCSESAAAETRGAQQIIDALSGKSLETLASLVSGVPGRRRPEDQIDRMRSI